MPVGMPNVTGQGLAAHRVTVPGVQDAIYNPLYDAVSYATTGILQANFFSTPIGQGTTSAPAATGAKTEADTNMTNAGLLPAGNRFYCTGIEFLIFPSAPMGETAVLANTGAFWNDVYALAKSGWVRFRIQNRDYVLDAPLINFPPQARLAGVSAVATVATATTMIEVNYATLAGAPYNIVPVFIQSNQAFSVQVNWPALVTVSATVRLFCRLRGQLIRDAQ
jgi:hypothetical protein